MWSIYHGVRLLTQRQRDVVLLYAAYYERATIADELGIGYRNLANT